MNKIQLIELLKLRDVTELKGESITAAIKRTGGDPTMEEMVIVNKNAMDYYIDKYLKEQRLREELNGENIILSNKNKKLQEDITQLIIANEKHQ